MGEENTQEKSPSFVLGWLIAPLAVLLAFVSSEAVGFELMNETSGIDFGMLIGAAILATIPRILRDSDSLSLTNNQAALALFTIALLASWGAEQVSGPTIGMLVFILAFGGFLLDYSGRFESSTILTFAVIGFMLALVVAGMADTWAPEVFDSNNDGIDENFTNNNREATGFLFFSTLFASILIGGIVAIAQRGLLHRAGDGRWAQYLPEPDGMLPAKQVLPLMLALAVWAAAHIGTMIQFGMGDEIVRLGLTIDEVKYSHAGFFWAFFTGLLAMIVAFFCAERWYTRAMLLSSAWILYTAGLWQEHEYYTVDALTGTWGVFIWLGMTFFAFVGTFYIATHEKYGNWSNRELINPSAARQWWSENWATILIFSAFAFGLAIRVIWNVLPAMNATGTGGWDMTGGSDPWYMKRAVDYIIANNAHFIIDADRAYPIGAINPRPPLFTWSLALGGFMIAPFIGTTPEEAVWWSVCALPAIYGALTVFPLAAMAKEHFGKGAGVIAAWLIAFMPGHVSHSTFALADHDAFVLLFLSTGFHFYLKAVKYGGSERLTKEANFSLRYLVEATTAVFKKRPAAISYAVMAGVSIGIVALGWKGFVYGPGILFLAFATQVVLNLLKRRDSTILAVTTVLMLLISFALPLPVYGHFQLDLIWDSSGMQPLFYILGFTLALGILAVCSRDKPWLLVLLTAFVSSVMIFGTLWLLQFAGIYNGWDVLTTGGFYFTKNKIFGTIAEAQAPSRGMLFASFGPIVFLLALGAGIVGIWQGVRHNQVSRLILGLWVLIASVMSWNAGRFVFNATPAMAVLGAWAIVALWNVSGANKFSMTWRHLGVRTPADRFTAARRAVWKSPAFSAMTLIILLLVSQHATYGLDSGIPRGNSAANDIDEEIFHFAPDILRYDIWDFSILDNTPYDSGSSNLEYLGAFGPGFNGYGWNVAHDWLANQDTDQAFGDRPAFVSWWDYGFQALAQGQHPTVSDNFQSGIPATGNMLLSRSQEDLMALFIWQLGEGDLTYNEARTGDYDFTPSFETTLDRHLTSAQFAELRSIVSELGVDGVSERMFKVTQVNRDIVMAEGKIVTDGILQPTMVYRIYDAEEVVGCNNQTDDCAGDDFVLETGAQRLFDSRIRTADDTDKSTTHYIVGEYWYTSDIIDEFDSVSSNLHRKNARLALARQMLITSLDTQGLADLYADLMDNRVYTVQDSEGMPGEMLTRNHEIRYFAVDNRLYPVGGHSNQDRYYNYGNPTGIFHAPTTLGGQDVEHFLETVYMTERGSFPDEMSVDEWYEAQRQDILAQQSGTDLDPIQLVDVRVDHRASFFETMIARTYVGYGASTLGLDVGSSNPQPAQHFQQSGSPGSVLSSAPTMPAAMMNHFVIANWYGAGAPDHVDFPNQFVDIRGVGVANTLVKVLKYYTGTEVCGRVQMSDDGLGMTGVRVLVERDAFSGDDAKDMDNNTYWIPLASTDVDDSGNWCTVVPAGHMRFSAYIGENNPVVDQDDIKAGELGEKLQDLTTTYNDDRDTNQLTGLLGRVSNMTWLSEVHLNITGEEGHSGDRYADDVIIEIESSGISGSISWTGHESFEGDALVDTDFILRGIWSLTDNVTVTTTGGTFTTDIERIVQGEGEVTFTETGEFTSEGAATVYNFSGNYTRTLSDRQSYTSNGTWSGGGMIDAVWINATDVADCTNASDLDNASMPENETVCLMSSDGSVTKYMVNGEVAAQGRFTAQGDVQFTRLMSGATFEGAGRFVGTGTINGTGLFIGIGTFSGPMVEPGSFYVTGLMPGRYNMIAQLDSGREVLLPDPVDIGISASYGVEMTIPGSFFNDTMLDSEGNVLANFTFELQDLGLADEDVILITTNETGYFEVGPLPPGDYYYRFDLDNDSFYEFNGTLFVMDDPSNLSIDFAIPVHQDVRIHLADSIFNSTTGQHELWDNSNRTVSFINSDFQSFVVNATSNETGDILVELPMGMWIGTDISDDVYILYDEFKLLTDDLSLQWFYKKSVNVTGVVMMPEVFGEQSPEGENLPVNHLPASGIGVQFRSGNIIVTDVTNSSGMFEVSLPEGIEFSVTAFSVTNQSAAGVHINVSDGMEALNLTFELASTGIGWLYIYDNVSTYAEGLTGWEQVEIQAMDEDNVSWFTEIDKEGRFAFKLPDGIYTLSALNTDINVSEMEVELNGSGGAEWQLIGQPGLMSVNFEVFLDTGKDSTWENGTPINVDMRFIPLMDNHGYQINITSDNYSATGNLTVELRLGVYDVQFDEQDPRNNASDHQTKNTQPALSVGVGLEPSADAVPVTLEASWLVEATLRNVSNGIIDNSTVWLYDLDGENYELLVSDENGTIAAYVPMGNYSVVVPPTEIDGFQQELRSTLVVNATETRRGMTWKTIASTWIDIQFNDSSGEMSDGFVLTAVSLDGLGNVSLGATNETGYFRDSIMPGNWTLYLNNTRVQTRWTVEEGEYNLTRDFLQPGANVTLEVSAQTWVEIGGKVYWDLNGDELPGLDEGIEDVNVTILGNSTDVNVTVQTENGGVWKLFVPVKDLYNVTIYKEGFAAEWYGNESVNGYEVNESHVSRDIMMTAGQVSISGNITHLFDDVEVLNRTQVWLYPKAGLDRVALQANITLNGTTLEWSAEVTPGNWVVWAQLQNAAASEFDVAISHIDAGVATGGSLDMEMRDGGVINMTSSWLDFNLGEHNLGDSESPGASIIDAPVLIILELNPNTKWELPVGEDGELDILLPSGTVSFSTEFSTTQRNRTMNYSGGISSQVGSQAESPVSIQSQRRVEHSVSFEVISVIGATYEDDDLMHLNGTWVDVVGAEYSAITIEVDVTYSGNEANDYFYASPMMSSNSPDTGSWIVEILNETGIWTDSSDLELGIGDVDANASLSQKITIRVQAPNGTSIQISDSGHRVNLRLEAEGGSVSEVSVEVTMPQTFGIELIDPAESAGAGAGGEGTMEITLKNIGNGDDSMVITVDDSQLPDGWDVSPESVTVTLTKNSTRTQTFVIHAPENATSGTWPLTLTFTSEDGITSVTHVVDILLAKADLVIERIFTRSDAPYFGEDNTFLVTVRNDGLLDANAVSVTLSTTYSDVSNSFMMAVPAGTTKEFVISMDLTDADAGPELFVAHIDAGDTPLERTPADLTQSIKIVSRPADEPSDALTWILAGIIALIALAVFNNWRKRGTGARF
ncbi:MAG: hypothetical protein CXX80_03785 [Methanobacteriota archaeon]|nr:MAG: hypothetical protein CXX80_09825 [Euryarchaeota archaeon]PXY75871.1 MAG: hypothetical protein CXX80_03785 [Euryarchaeota archaeon]HIA90318.1 hypothetical protein [Candidatus Poseidoniales archaeon]